VLDDSGIVRQDISSPFGTSTTAAGVPLTLDLTVLDSSSGCSALAGVAVYVWHADAQGRDAVYADGATYASSADNLARTSLTREMAFGDDGGIHQLATVAGDASAGDVANLTIAV
jgi:protocatechuate 3,4-dioxygenase beta subunit